MMRTDSGGCLSLKHSGNIKRIFNSASCYLNKIYIKYNAAKMCPYQVTQNEAYFLYKEWKSSIKTNHGLFLMQNYGKRFLRFHNIRTTRKGKLTQFVFVSLALKKELLGEKNIDL